MYGGQGSKFVKVPPIKRRFLVGMGTEIGLEVESEK